MGSAKPDLAGNSLTLVKYSQEMVCHAAKIHNQGKEQPHGTTYSRKGAQDCWSDG
jgi:hypothetical protein